MIFSADLNVRSFLLISRRLNFNVGYLMVSSSVHNYLIVSSSVHSYLMVSSSVHNSLPGLVAWKYCNSLKVKLVYDTSILKHIYKSKIL